MTSKTISKKTISMFLLLALATILSAGCASKSKQDVLNTVKTYNNADKIALERQKYQEIILNSDISAREGLVGDDGIVYKNLTSFDIYTRPLRIDYTDDYFIVIPEHWQKLYVKDNGIYLNYIPIE